MPQTVSQAQETEIDPSRLRFDDSGEESSIFILKKAFSPHGAEMGVGNMNKQSAVSESG